MTTVDQEVRTFLSENFSLGKDLSHLSSTQSLTERGFIDSVGIVELLTFLETRFDIQINDTIDNIVRFIGEKRGALEATARDAGA